MEGKKRNRVRRPKCSVVIVLKSGETVELFISPRPRTVGFASVENLRSFYVTMDYKPKGEN